MGDNEMVAEVFTEWGIIAILVAVVILFGSTKLPKFARSLGSAQSEFKKGLSDGSKNEEQPAGKEQQASAADSPHESADTKNQ